MIAPGRRLCPSRPREAAEAILADGTPPTCRKSSSFGIVASGCGGGGAPGTQQPSAQPKGSNPAPALDPPPHLSAAASLPLAPPSPKVEGPLSAREKARSTSINASAAPLPHPSRRSTNEKWGLFRPPPLFSGPAASCRNAHQAANLTSSTQLSPPRPASSPPFARKTCSKRTCLLDLQSLRYSRVARFPSRPAEISTRALGSSPKASTRTEGRELSGPADPNFLSPSSELTKSKDAPWFEAIRGKARALSEARCFSCLVPRRILLLTGRFARRSLTTTLEQYDTETQELTPHPARSPSRHRSSRVSRDPRGLVTTETVANLVRSLNPSCSTRRSGSAPKPSVSTRQRSRLASKRTRTLPEGRGEHVRTAPKSETTTEAKDWELAHELYRRHSADLSSSLRTRGPSSLSAILAQCVRLATRGSDQAAIVLEEPGKKTKQKKPVLPPGWRIRLPPGWRIPRSGEKEKQLRRIAQQLLLQKKKITCRRGRFGTRASPRTWRGTPPQRTSSA